MPLSEGGRNGKSPDIAERFGDRFWDAGVEDVCHAGLAWPAARVTLLVNQFRGRLLFQATDVPALVPESLVDTFLDRVVADLIVECSPCPAATII